MSTERENPLGAALGAPALKFRVFNPRFNEFNYWGFMDGHFKGPPTGSNLTIGDCSKSDRFTGLKDRNEKEIYAGDIVSIVYDAFDEEGQPKEKLNPAVGFVAWNEHSTGWVIRTKSPMSVNKEGTVMTSLIHGAYGYREVIGNIYQNPELL